jgi:hypothetical protein
MVQERLAAAVEGGPSIRLLVADVGSAYRALGPTTPRPAPFNRLA